MVKPIERHICLSEDEALTLEAEMAEHRRTGMVLVPAISDPGYIEIAARWQVYRDGRWLGSSRDEAEAWRMLEDRN